MSKTDSSVNIIIPLGGIGLRFSKEGYTQPKPLINVFGKPLLFWVLDNLKIEKLHDNIIIIYHPILDNYNFKYIILSNYPNHNIKLIKLDKPTQGASETIKFGLEHLSPSELSKNFMCIDGDTFYRCDIVSMYKTDPGNRVYCFPRMQFIHIFL